jgi:hypothetical protein
MKYIARFEKVDGVRILVPFETLNPDGSLLTTCIMTSGRDERLKGKHFTYALLEGNYKVYRVTPRVSFDIFEFTRDYKEANLLRIDYYLGQSTYDIIKAEENNVFIVEEKLPVKYRLPNETEERLGRVNDILKYIGLEHVEKPLGKVQYEGDAYTKIQLQDDCRYNLFKFIKVYKLTK